ncbi:hypothetical protein V8E55_010114 [Tylopilus felleus]
MESTKKILAKCSNVTVKTTSDVEAVLRAYIRGHPDLEEPQTPKRGDIVLFRRTLVASGTVIIYEGARYKDGLGWTKVTVKDSDFQMYRLLAQPDIWKFTIRFTIRFNHNHNPLHGSVVSYQADGSTHRNVSDALPLETSAPENEPIVQLILNKGDNQEEHEPSPLLESGGISKEDDVEQGDLASIGAHTSSRMTFTIDTLLNPCNCQSIMNCTCTPKRNTIFQSAEHGDR